MRLVLGILLLVLLLVPAASAGVIYEFYGFRDNLNQTFTLVLPDYFPAAPNNFVEYVPGVDNLTCAGCTSVYFGHWDGVSWDDDQIWFSDPGVTQIYRFNYYTLNAGPGVYQSQDGDARLTIREGEVAPGAVPEPGTLGLALLGGIAALAWGRRRRIRA